MTIATRRGMFNAALLLLAGAMPEATAAQQSGGVPPRTVAGQVGERQTREDAGGADMQVRIPGRIANRVQSRIRNRIDRFYDPAANAASPFTVAADQARAAGRSSPR